MIPVKIANDSTVTTVATNDPSWYNYQNREWANAVLVKENGVKTRAENKVVGTIINQDDILAYYVWIPRYKYAFSEQTKCGCIDNVNETDYPDCYENSELIPDNTYNNPRTIDIVFENGTPAKSNGTAIGTSYYTHPAFTFGSEELPGFWVGKFESSTDPSSECYTSPSYDDCNNINHMPRIVPNVDSLRYQYIGNQFAVSLKFAGGTQSGSNVTFAGSSTYGLTSTADSHMMKNSEWGAVAYLSHSAYGINEEIRINNYRQSSSPYRTLTGCGASTTNENLSDTCGITYGENTSYPQSTTDNISGVFDMSGGAWEYVMGNYNNSTDTTFFNALPASKYYDNYPANIFTGNYTTNMTFCTLATCGGHALYETVNWYKDYADFVTLGFDWFVRGGTSNFGQRSGEFTSFSNSGASDLTYSWRSVLVAK